MHRDLTNLSTEKPPFDQIKILRTQYLTDIQILVRNNEDPIAGLSTLRGRGLTDGKAFCVMSTDGMAFTPFALKHQIEHLVQNGVPSHEWSQRSSYLSSLRSHLKQSMIPLSPYHAFARHPDWYSTENGMESVVWDTLIRFSQNDPESGGILLPHWDLKWLDASSMTSCHSDCHSVGSDTLTKADIHQNTSRDPFGGIPIRIQPNPTSGKTRVEYAVADHQQGVTMRISTLTGQFIQFLVDDGEHPFGTYALQWDADWLPNGVYLCTLRAGGQTRTTRIVVSH
jgi:hypothetical protein